MKVGLAGTPFKEFKVSALKPESLRAWETDRAAPIGSLRAYRLNCKFGI